MKHNSLNKILSLVLCIALIAAMALSFVGCGSAEDAGTTTASTTGSESNVLGEGETVFTLTVVDPDGNETSYEIHTDETTVGAALVALELVSGEDSDYGLYVTTVNGITLDWDTDGMYWAFYIDGEYAMTGVDSTDIVAGTTYTLKAE